MYEEFALLSEAVIFILYMTTSATSPGAQWRESEETVWEKVCDILLHEIHCVSLLSIFSHNTFKKCPLWAVLPRGMF